MYRSGMIVLFALSVGNGNVEAASNAENMENSKIWADEIMANLQEVYKICTPLSKMAQDGDVVGARAGIDKARPLFLKGNDSLAKLKVLREDLDVQRNALPKNKKYTLNAYWTAITDDYGLSVARQFQTGYSLGLAYFFLITKAVDLADRRVSLAKRALDLNDLKEAKTQLDVADWFVKEAVRSYSDMAAIPDDRAPSRKGIVNDVRQDFNLVMAAYKVASNDKSGNSDGDNNGGSNPANGGSGGNGGGGGGNGGVGNVILADPKLNGLNFDQAMEYVKRIVQESGSYTIQGMVTASF